MSKPKVGIRTTAGPLIGTGHLRRCVTLAKWLDQDVDVELMVAPDTSGPASAEAMQRWFAEQGINGALVPPSFDGLGTASHYRGHVALVIDDYALTDEVLRQHIKRWPTTFVLDDLAERELKGVAGIINPTVDVTAADYANTKPRHLLVGPTYALLDPSFAAGVAAQERIFPSKIARVLVTSGGSDPADQTPVLLRATLEALPEAEIDVVVGPWFSQRCRALLDGIAALHARVHLHDQPKTLLPLMLECDLALSAAGQTLFELAATATPTVAVAIAENQKRNLRAMSEQGILRAAIPSVVDAIRALTERDVRRDLGLRAQQVIDGHGGERVAQALRRDIFS